MLILGINAYHGDAAAAIVRDGELIAAAEEERFNRIKHCAGFPTQAIQYCLKAAGASIGEVDHVGISRDPSAHLHKKILFAAGKLARGQRAEARGQRAESREQRSEVGGQRSEVGGQRTEVGGQRTEVRGQRSEARSQRAESRGQGVSPSASRWPLDATASRWPLDVQEPRPANGNGNGKGFFSLVKDRLANAAKVRDLKSELARALSVSPKDIRAQFHNIEHHRAHLASAFYVSPFEKAALLSIDGFGDFISTMWAAGEGNSIEVLGQVEYPHSAGIVYTATTQFLGFPHYGDEGKVMGLAPYGKPRFMEEFRDIIRTEGGGRFKLNLDYFRHHSEGVEMTWDDGSPVIGRIFSDEFARLFGPPREKGAPLTDREHDIAASLQQRLEEVAFHVLNHLHDQTGLTDLGLAGGVAYNSVMNGKILLHTPFRRVFVQPAAGDSGTAVGAAYHIYNQFRVSSSEFRVKGNGHIDAEVGGQRSEVGGQRSESRGQRSEVGGQRSEGRGQRSEVGGQRAASRFPHPASPLPLPAYRRYFMEGAYTGPEFSDEEIQTELEASGLEFEKYSSRELTRRAAQDIAGGSVVGWFQGRMEFGPRALGNRSIVVDPRRADMKDILNDRIKKREPFRPFAPSILAERVGEYFEQTHPAPTMLMVYQVRAEKRAEIPAVTHVDGSGRLQTVSRELNSRYYQLISDFHELTGVPVVLNTSFNENEPIVCTPREAIDCFLKTRMDVLYVGRFAVRREK